MTSVPSVSEFRLKRRVQFYETDAAGIVHFSIYPRFMEEAENALWRSAGLSVVPMVEAYGFLRVAFACDYKAPLGFDDEFEAVIRIVGITERSIRYACDVTLGDTLVASMTMAVVCAAAGDDGVRRAVPIPTHVRERLDVANVGAAVTTVGQPKQ